ncbi:hypothetical protein HNY73_016044 [Argiope bruennichi]|uniref:Uncharacterized protein n=1 Tax=Argiope bruennichi TaxID=94029 RepID=A0A8T0EIS5_ARGBR|nr:hypothetical protein HNY73_016044 [Argiope bruennichi]
MTHNFTVVLRLGVDNSTTVSIQDEARPVCGAHRLALKFCSHSHGCFETIWWGGASPSALIPRSIPRDNKQTNTINQ